MATQTSGLVIDIVAFSVRLLEEREVSARARLTVRTIADLLPGIAANLYLLTAAEDGHVWVPQATLGEAPVHDSSVPAGQGALGAIVAESEPVLFSGQELTREEYSHLIVRRTVKSLGYLPLIAKDGLMGVIEILAFDAELSAAALHSLVPLSQVCASGLVAALACEEDRHNSLASISRLTQFYDLEKVFGSTLEMDQLVPIIGSKFREVLECQGVNVWLLQPDDSLLLMHQAGLDPTVSQNTTQRPGQGLAGDVSDSGEPVLIVSGEDERLVQRNAGVEQGAIFSMMAAPLLDEGCLVGVVEAINKRDGLAFDEDDLFALTSLNDTAVGALHNASLLLAERKVEVLEALVKTSSEITSTLDLDRVLQAVVNGPASVVPYERAAIALDQRGRTQLRAVSGNLEFNPEDPSIHALSQILQWASLLREPEVVTQHGEEVSAQREETRAKFQHYFAETGMRAFHAVPLADEEGRVGVLSFESSDPDFLSVAHLEMIKVLASQATVALRNASLYKEVPFIGVLQPLFQKKRQFLALEKHRRVTLVAGAGIALLFLVLFPLPLRVDGPAVVAPGRSARIGAEIEGVVKQVNVREGDTVRKGTVLGSLEDWEYRSALAAAEANRQTAFTRMDRALAANDGTEAGVQQTQADYWTAEVARARERLDRMQLRSPIDGVVATPHIENMVGHKLKFGEVFADVVDNSQATVDVAIDQNDIALVTDGQNARVKLDGFPARTFQGQVVVVSPIGNIERDTRTFSARVAVANRDGVLRAGMQGRGKVSTGWHPAGQVFFRRPAAWIWSKLWDWFGW